MRTPDPGDNIENDLSPGELEELRQQREARLAELEQLLRVARTHVRTLEAEENFLRLHKRLDELQQPKVVVISEKDG